jgi:hypothetical protein
MNQLWLAARYLFDMAYCRARNALRGEPESGALSLEWIVIAALLVTAAGVAAGFISNAISNESKKLP